MSKNQNMSSTNSKNSDKKKLNLIGNVPIVNMDNRRGSHEKFLEL